jgi:hypothetical protein
MRLNEIKQVVAGEVNLLEGVIPVHLTMTLEQVVKAGKLTNNVQTFTLAHLAALFKHGGPYKWPRELNPYAAHGGTSSDMIAAVRSLTNEEVASLAAWLLEQLQGIASYEARPFKTCAAPHEAPEAWLRYVLSRQD